MKKKKYSVFGQLNILYCLIKGAERICHMEIHFGDTFYDVLKGEYRPSSEYYNEWWMDWEGYPEYEIVIINEKAPR